MRNLIAKFTNFMRDRYARIDSISLACLIAHIIIDLIAVFFKRDLLVWFVLFVVSTMFVAYAIYRPFSKSIWKRMAEERAFRAFLKKAKAGVVLFARTIKYARVSVFRKCPRCGSVIRFPRKKGEHNAKCPACGEKFKVKVIF